MSYILDAIRKSDLQRSRGAAPTLMTSHSTPQAAKRPATWFYAALAALLLAAGIAIGWLRPWQTQPAAPAPAATPPVTVPALPPLSIAPDPPRKFERESAIAKAPLPAAPPAVAVTATPAPHSAAAASTAPVPTIAVVSPPAPALSAVDKATVDATGEAKTLNFNELPMAIQQEIPHLAVSVHAYSSEPKKRLVTIDDRMLHEGDTAGPGLKLEQITADGMIFSYKGYRFRRSVRDIVNNR